MILTPPNIDRRQQSRHLVDELKKERQEVWSMYCNVAELKPFSPQQKVQLKLTKFSQLLVDYISLGHFGIYDRLVTGDERRAGVLNMAEQIYPELSRTTDVAIAFNDKYEDVEESLNLESLEYDLSHLGEHLAIRIDLEDKLCNMLLN